MKTLKKYGKTIGIFLGIILILCAILACFNIAIIMTK